MYCTSCSTFGLKFSNFYNTVKNILATLCSPLINNLSHW